jgi:hypothetical protein
MNGSKNSNAYKKVNTVYRGYHHGYWKPLPVIRLKGKFLKRIGFDIGDKIEVLLQPGTITLRKVLI